MLYSSTGWAHCCMGFSDVLVCKRRCVWYDTGMRHSLTDGVGASNPPTPVEVPAWRPAAYMLYIPVARH